MTGNELRGTTRTILHADMDAFYASVEARENPEIADRPIVVGADPRAGRGRGVVAACNYRAREYGIGSAMPISEAYRRCPDAVFLPVRMELYARVSERVMATLESFTDRVERLSIDEAFLDVTDSARLFGDGVAIARQIKRRIRESERLTVSVGVAFNKFLAKLASDLEKPDGLVVVEPGRERTFLRPLPVERLWGVGPRTAEELRRAGLRTIGDVADASLHSLDALVGGRTALRLHRLAQGRDDRPVEPEREPKQIGRETTFPHDVEDRQRVERTLLELTEEVSARLRRRHLAARTVTVKLRLAPFETLTRQRTVEARLSTTEGIFPIARQLLADADPGDRAIRLVGISLSGLHEPEPTDQLSLFGRSEPQARGRGVSRVLDRLADRFGDRAVRRARLLESGGGESGPG